MIIDSRYKVLKKLGAGLWATVYKVQDIRTDEIYALKLFQMLDSDSLYEKFSAENMHHITKLQHPNLIHVSDFGNFGKHIYYISEYFEGKTLSAFKFSKSSIDLLYDIIVQICYGLSALHSQNIIHHDLKPENVVYRVKNNKPILKVMDYGFTKIDLQKNNQKAGRVLPYIAPEVYMGQRAVTQSDFYSLGAILYKITTGILPYTSEQISAIMSGDMHNLFPSFPREINPEIPDGLEKLIMLLLEKDPADRIKNVEGIIAHVNSFQTKKYPYSRRWSLVNAIQFSDYIVREAYAHQLIDYLPIIERGNGKIISLTAGKGLGKNNVLTLFRYHLLSDRYFIFDYECSEKHKDPFFALIKEFYRSRESNERIGDDLTNISEKLKEYLFSSEEEATMLIQDQQELDLDYQSASNFIYHLSEVKPLIFVIRAIEHLPKEVVDFVNYITREVSERPILIILSTNDPRQLEGLIHSIMIKIEALDLEQTRTYINRLLRVSPPDVFIKKIWERSNGNPLFIETILIDLIHNHQIWEKNTFTFDYELDNYHLPQELVSDIQHRIDHLSKISFKHFVTLSSISTPLGNDLIKYILEIGDKELFFFLKEGLNNELLCKSGEFHEITFKEAREHFLARSKKKDIDAVSRKVLTFFKDINLTLVPIAQGIIQHALSVDDFMAARDYYLRLVQLFSEKGLQEKAFSVMCQIIDLDFTGKTTIAPFELKKDLKLLLEKSEWATVDTISQSLQNHIRRMPDVAEKHLIMGVFYLVSEKLSLARNRFEKALKLSLTGAQKISILLKLSYTYFLQGKLDKMRGCIEELEGYTLSYELQIEFIAYKTLFLGNSGRLNESIQLAEEYLGQVQVDNDANHFIRLGNLHNTLALMYHKNKMLDEAEKHFENARTIWERVKYKRKLGIAYNNIGDVALIKGDTARAFEYFRKAMQVCTQVNCKRVRVQGLLNHAQAYIKLGHFNLAEGYLGDALKLCLKLENKPFYTSIINNMAIAKSKINNLNYYHSFVEKNMPDIVKGSISKMSPLTKTYFYYLQEIGDYDKIELLLTKYETLFLESREHEFTNQMQGFLASYNGNIPLALDKIEKAYNYSKKNQSDYALAINYIRLIECFVSMDDYEKAYNICSKVEKLCEKHNFRYWETQLDIKKIKIQLLDENVSIRPILRKLREVLPYVQENHLYLIEIEVYELMVQIYNYLSIRRKAERSFEKYQELLVKAAEGLNDVDADLYLRTKKHYLNDYTGLRTVNIAPRKHLDGERWQEELFDILKLREETRMKFLINRTIQTLLSPDSFAIVLKEEIITKSTPFINKNILSSTLYSKRYQKNISLCFEKNKIVRRSIEQRHILFIPLKIKSSEVGCMILADNGELPYQPKEIAIIKILRLHLTTIMIRIKEFAALNKDMELMSKLVEITRNFFSILSVDRLEQEVIATALDFTEGSRGFLIKKDKFENYVYKVALDDSKHLLKSYVFISKTILSEVQQLKQPIFSENVIEDKIFGSYLEYAGDAFSIYCAPIIVDGNIHGYLYLDNFSSESGAMSINHEFMRLLLIQISVAFKNAMQYESLMHKNKEINSLDDLKNDFISIASHELNTPLTTLLGYTGKLARSKLGETEKETIGKMKISVNRLQTLVKDLLDFNRYSMAGNLEKDTVNIKPLLQGMAEETEQISAFRHMQIKLEVEDQLKSIKVHTQSFHLLLYHIVANAIRFTNDFGTITLGARHSTFQQEEINGDPSLVIYIQDNGIGMPEGELTKVFQKFYELSDIISHSSGHLEFKSGGLGIGLSIAKLITDLHNGKIWISSKENEGTTVFIAVPL